MVERRFVAALLVGVGALLFSGRALAVTIEVLPSGGVVSTGGLLDVAVTITGLGSGAAPSVGVLDLDLSFDPTVFLPVSGTLGDPIHGDQLDVLGLGSLAIVTVGPSSVNLFELSFDLPSDLDTLQQASFIIGTLTLEAIGIGASALSVSVNALGDSLGAPLSPSVSNSTATVVPEPTTGLLLATGLGSIAAARRLGRGPRTGPRGWLE